MGFRTLTAKAFLAIGTALVKVRNSVNKMDKEVQKSRQFNRTLDDKLGRKSDQKEDVSLLKRFAALVARIKEQENPDKKVKASKAVAGEV